MCFIGRAHGRPRSLLVTAALVMVGSNVVAADLDGDGHDEVMVVGGATSGVLTGNGAGGLLPTHLAPAGDSSVDLAVLDLDGTGRPDAADSSLPDDVVGPRPARSRSAVPSPLVGVADRLVLLRLRGDCPD